MQRLIILSFSLIITGSLFAQEGQKTRKVGWFLNPEYSALLHRDHVGNAVGLQTGIRILQNRLHVGIFAYGRSGPINGQTFPLTLPDGQTYKGKSSLEVRADQGAFGILLAPQFSISDQWSMDIPVLAGQMGAGFYLFGEDRNTPDGRRVSEWENELMGGTDAGFSLHFEGGVRFKYALHAHAKMTLGLHYAYAPQWETFVGGAGFYNVPRISLGVEFGN
ncbi:MAG: hypothetical protein AAFV07_13740 [Bacteroidota bacterium]